MNFIQKTTLSYSQNYLKKQLKQKFKFKQNEQINKQSTHNNELMLYIHIPFCHTFCPYCSFHKFAYDEQKCKEYFEILRIELKQLKDYGYNFNTLYVGGGTTLINEKELIKTLILVKELFNIKEISCETDPNHIKPEILKDFVGLIDRLSCGIQSFDDEILQKTSRLEKFGNHKELIKKLENAIGILPTFSIDLIFNFPFQSEKMLLNDINIAKNIAPEQITMYPLMKSNITKDAISAKFGIDNNNNELKYYQIICDMFKDYKQNNSWSFSKNKTKFNDEYVSTHHEYIGAGSGAFSFTNNKLLINAFKLDEYKNLILNKKNANIAHINFNDNDVIDYVFLTELFSGKINVKKINDTYKCDLINYLGYKFKGLKYSNAIVFEDNIIYNTEFGKYLALVLMKEFYINMDLVRAYFRKDL
ncbi:coproporphyrinogen III oxidase family protein [Campylobacter sp. MG1]|uniref:coproporphyrinogen III oxidase family protein n=1 Tax=Campylobacter sp. MG1 TaxID=2976332 RepID=UPI00226CD7AA|nr:coproporphyrinogen III oxidase family protein [Campylobacter sp. MG1]